MIERLIPLKFKNNDDDYGDALGLCGLIEKYWKDKGYLGIKAWVEKRAACKMQYKRQIITVPSGWVIKSNIGALGYPPA